MLAPHCPATLRHRTGQAYSSPSLQAVDPINHGHQPITVRARRRREHIVCVLPSTDEIREDDASLCVGRAGDEDGVMPR